MLAVLLACSGDGGGSSADDEGSAAGPPASSARCVGDAVPSTQMRDSESCAKQGAQWDGSSLECRATPFVPSCERGANEGDCLDMPGCGWTDDNGNVVHPSGSCTGDKIPCASLAEATCASQPGCIYFTSTGCEDKNGYNYLDNVGCAELQVGDDVAFSVVRSACQRAQGCTWVDG